MPSKLLTIFLSYVSEDAPLAQAIGPRLSDTFRGSVDIRYMAEFPLGLNYRALINEAAEAADILLLITTGRKKPSHSYTGYEIGYFRRSQEARKCIDGTKIDRLIIPFSIFTGPPPAADEFQGIWMDAEVFKYRVEEVGKIDDKSKDPFFKLLERINGILNKINETYPSWEVEKRTHEQFTDQAKSFYKEVNDFMRSIPVSTAFPKPRLTLRLPPDLTPKDIKIDDVRLSCSGPNPGIFAQGQSEDSVSWTDFSKRIGNPDIAFIWDDALRSLVSSILNDNFADTGHEVFSYDEKKLFRLFLSESRKFGDGSRELDVYLVEILHDKDVGDPKTTFLAAIISIAMAYRSLFVERNSPYSHNAIALLDEQEWKSTISELQRDLRLLYARSKEAGAFDPVWLTAIYGDDPKAIENVNCMRKELSEELNRVKSTAAKVLEEPTQAKFDAFAQALDEFRTKTIERDTPYLTKILEHLKRIVGSGAINLELAGDMEGPTEILLNGKKVKEISAQTAALIKLPSGQHSIEVRGTKDGKPVSKFVTIEPGKDAEMKLTVH